jgi:hypothetical protein
MSAVSWGTTKNIVVGLVVYYSNCYAYVRSNLLDIYFFYIIEEYIHTLKKHLHLAVYFKMSSPFISYISNEQHYHNVIQAVFNVRHDLWIATSDMKDLYVKRNNVVIPFLKVLADLIQKKVKIRLIHAKEPGQNFRNDFDKNPFYSKDWKECCVQECILKC